MKKARQRKLIAWTSVVLTIAAVVALILFALRQNINLFYSPSELLEQSVPLTRLVRVGGMVVKNSIARDSDSLKVRFTITDLEQPLLIHYTGILPDLFREGQGVIVRGRLRNDGTFVAEEVLAKHDENYMPPEVRNSLRFVS